MKGKQAEIKIKDVKVKAVEFKPELVTTKPDELKKIRALLPETKQEKISLENLKVKLQKEIAERL